MADDKETKNIDGIKPPEDADGAAAEKITVNIKEDTAVANETTDVNISSDGNIAVETDENKKNDDSKDNESVSTLTTDPVETQETTEPSKEVNTNDPGIVPSVQPAQAMAASPATEVARLKERNKHLKIWLVVLMLLLVAVASALVVYFAGQSKAKSDLKAQQQQNEQLQAQLATQQQTTTQQTINDLNTQLAAEKAKNDELQKTIDAQEQQITAYQTAIKELTKLCGTACSSVDIPEETTDTNTTN